MVECVDIKHVFYMGNDSATKFKMAESAMLNIETNCRQCHIILPIFVKSWWECYNGYCRMLVRFMQDVSNSGPFKIPRKSIQKLTSILSSCLYRPTVGRCGVAGSRLVFGSIDRGFESDSRFFLHHSASASSKLRSLT